MSFVSKLKNFFYEEEEVEEEVFEKPKKVEKEQKKENKINIYDIEKEKTRATLKNKKETESNEIPERELFKSERTFNFPIDMDEDDDFQPVMEKNRGQAIEQRQEVDIETHVNRVTRSNFSNTNSSHGAYKHSSQSTRNYSSVNYEPLIHKKEEKRFKPTPIISPVYGVLDKNYTADGDRNLSETKEFNFGPSLDFDTVRKKAYGEEEKKDIFYNLEEEKKNNKKESENVEEEYKEEPYKKDEVIITYEQVPEENETKENVEEEEVEVPKITRSKRTKKKIKQENNVLDETKEHDLFDLIDNMYSEEEEEEDE